jgi:Sec-independent protein translocase protein TatA
MATLGWREVLVILIVALVIVGIVKLRTRRG